MFTNYVRNHLTSLDRAAGIVGELLGGGGHEFSGGPHLTTNQMSVFKRWTNRRSVFRSLTSSTHASISCSISGCSSAITCTKPTNQNTAI